jgi:hypothetical protein
MAKKQKIINNQEPVSIIISMCFIIPFGFLFPNLIIHVNFCDFSSFSLFLTYKEKSSPTNNITSFYSDLLHLQNLAASQLLLRKK